MVSSSAGEFWPWFLAGLLSPLAARILTGLVPAHVAAGLSFFACFATASYVVSRNLGTDRRPLRILLGSAGGGVMLGVLTYAFPPH